MAEPNANVMGSSAVTEAPSIGLPCVSVTVPVIVPEAAIVSCMFTPEVVTP